MTFETVKLMFVGDHSSFSRSFQRLESLSEICEVRQALSTFPPDRCPGVTSGPSLISRIFNKLGYPLDTTNVNQLIAKHSKRNHYDVLWIEKALTVRPSTIKEFQRANPAGKVAWFSEDDMFLRHNQSKFFLKCLPLYDIVFTTKSLNCRENELPSLGAKNVVFVNKAYHKRLHRPIPLSPIESKTYSADVGFVGTYEEERAQLILKICEAGLPVRVWGNGWRHLSNTHENLRVEGRPLYGEDYVRALRATKINLCFLRKLNRDQQTDRTMEIPACEAFMLAERTTEQQNLFREGIEAEYFSNAQELIDKVRLYLNNEPSRNAIARAGRLRCIEQRYSHHDQLQYMLSKLIDPS